MVRRGVAQGFKSETDEVYARHWASGKQRDAFLTRHSPAREYSPRGTGREVKAERPNELCTPSGEDLNFKIIATLPRGGTAM